MSLNHLNNNFKDTGGGVFKKHGLQVTALFVKKINSICGFSRIKNLPIVTKIIKTRRYKSFRKNKNYLQAQKYLAALKYYRVLRYNLGLPIHGQRTHTNRQTCKKLAKR